MDNSILDRKQEKKFNKIAKQKAKWNQKELEAVAEFKETYSRETITKVLNVAREKGHPGDVNLSNVFENNYLEDCLTVEDVLTFDSLYKSNLKYITNKNDGTN